MRAHPFALSAVLLASGCFLIVDFDPDGSGGTSSVTGTGTATSMTDCGNGAVDVGEECDDGGPIDGDGCDSNCTLTTCGNGVVTDGEECDDGNAVNEDVCVEGCKIASCGDGFVQEGQEDCDPPGTEGCENCMLKMAYFVDGGPSTRRTSSALVGEDLLAVTPNGVVWRRSSAEDSQSETWVPEATLPRGRYRTLVVGPDGLHVAFAEEGAARVVVVDTSTLTNGVLDTVPTPATLLSGPAAR